MAYVALNRGRAGAASEMDVRIFGLHYADRRGTVPVDNRTLAVRHAVRQNDRDDIRVTTIGGHWVGTRRVGQAREGSSTPPFLGRFGCAEACTPYPLRSPATYGIKEVVRSTAVPSASSGVRRMGRRRSPW